MNNGVVNKVPFGVQNKDFEKVGAGSANRYEGQDGLIAGVEQAVRLVIAERKKNKSSEKRERVEAQLVDTLGQLFGSVESDGSAIESATGFAIGEKSFSYNSLHISVKNPDYVAPITTTTNLPNGGMQTSWDWSKACGSEFIDVTAKDVIENPHLGLELIVHNDFHL